MAAKRLPTLASAAAAVERERPTSRTRRDQAPPAVVRTGSRGEGKPFQLVLPPATWKALKIASVERETSTRHLILEALKDRGYPVPAGELVRRRD